MKRLLAERLAYHLGDVIGGDPDWDDFASRLATEISLPDYEAAVDALHAIYSGEIGFKNPHHPDIAKAREALRRLREGSAA